MSRRTVGNYRSTRAHGASIAMPARNRDSLFAAAGRILLALLGLSLVAVIAVGVREAFLQVNNQKINVVQIEGDLANLSRPELEETVSRFVADSLVSLDLALLKSSLESQPWIHSAEVRRVWPDRLIIRVREEVAIARWREDQLLNQEGQAFAPPSIDKHQSLPYLSGPEGTQELMMRQYLQFNQLLYPMGVRITDIELSERKSWTIRFGNASRSGAPLDIVAKVGKDEVLERMKRLVTFLGSVPLQELQSVASLDLRYTNGVALMPGNTGAQQAEDGLVAR